MSAKQFCPEFKSIPVRGGHAGIYRLFDDDAWSFVRENGEPLIRPSSGNALADAKRVVKTILNPEIKADQSGPSPHPAAQWRIEQMRKQSEAEQVAFGGVIHKGRTVPVEKRGCRRGRRV